MSAVRSTEYGILGKANLLLPLVLTIETKVSIMLKTCIRRKSKLLSQTFEVFLRDNCINYCLEILMIFKIHLHCKILKLA